MTEPTLTIYYVIKAILREDFEIVTGLSFEVEHPYTTIEEAKAIRDTMIDALWVRADTKPLAEKIFHRKNSRIMSVDKRIYKVQCITSVVEEDHD